MHSSRNTDENMSGKLSLEIATEAKTEDPVSSGGWIG